MIYSTPMQTRIWYELEALNIEQRSQPTQPTKIKPGLTKLRFIYGLALSFASTVCFSDFLRAYCSTHVINAYMSNYTLVHLPREDVITVATAWKWKAFSNTWKHWTWALNGENKEFHSNWKIGGKCIKRPYFQIAFNLAYWKMFGKLMWTWDRCIFRDQMLSFIYRKV